MQKIKRHGNAWLNHSKNNCPSRINDIAAIARVLYHYFLLLYSNSKGYFRPPEINPAARKRSRSIAAGTVGFSRVESPIPKFPVCCFGPLPADLSFGFGLAVGLPFLPFAKVRFFRRAGKAIRAHGGMDAALPALPKNGCWSLPAARRECAGILYPVGPGTDRPFHAVGARGQMGIVTQQYLVKPSRFIT